MWIFRWAMMSLLIVLLSLSPIFAAEPDDPNPSEKTAESAAEETTGGESAGESPPEKSTDEQPAEQPSDQEAEGPEETTDEPAKEPAEEEPDEKKPLATLVEKAEPEPEAEDLPDVIVEERLQPLKAADTSNPLATLKSFLAACDDTYELIRESDERVRSTGHEATIVSRIFQCLDLSKIPPALRRDSGATAAVCLKEVIDRIDLPPEWDIPDAEDVKAAEGKLKQWTIPNTEITIALVEEGPQAGRYLFSPNTVSRANEFFHRVKHLPYKEGASEGFYDWYLSEPGWMIPKLWIHALPRWTRMTVKDVTIWQWTGLVLTFIVGIVVMVLSYRAGQRLSRVEGRSSVFRYCITLAFPVAAMLVPLVVKYFVADQLRITGSVLAVVKITLDIAFLLALVVLLMGFVNRIAEILITSPRIHPKGIDAQLIRLSFRVGGLVVAVILLLEGGRQIGIPLTTLLAGAGVGGLTVALAAQDTLRNMFGSMMIILDKPYRVGERIVVKDYDGVVEEIGLRSTRIRLLTGHLATIPNEEMARTDVENISRRPHIRRTQDIALPFDTSPDKVTKAWEIIRDLLKDHEGQHPDFPPRVSVNEFNRDSINLRMIYWYHPPEYWDFLAQSQKLNIAIMEQFAAAGIEFALPSTTTFMTQDEKGRLHVDLVANTGDAATKPQDS